MRVNLYVFVVLFVSLSFVHPEPNLKLNLAGNYTLQVDAWGRDSVRVRIGPSIRDDIVWALLPPNTSNHKIIAVPSNFTNGNLFVSVDNNGLLTFTRLSDGKLLIKELNRLIVPNSLGYLSINITYSAFEDEKIFGLGEHKTGKLDNKNQTFVLADDLMYDLSHGGQVGIPYITSSRGYGFFWNLPSFGIITFNSSGSYWSSEAAYQMDIWVTTSTPQNPNFGFDIIQNYADATGHPLEFPYYASGFIQSKDRYRNQTQLISIVQEYANRGLPLSVIVIDWFHWTDFGDYRFNLNCWPNSTEMVNQIESLGVKVMITVWPLIDVDSINYQPMVEDGYFVSCPNATPVDNCHGYVPDYLYDPTIPNARQFLWDKIYEGYYVHGIKIWWLDASEPEQVDPHSRHIYSLGPEELIGMGYDLYHAQTFYDGMKANNETEIFTLSRSGWAGVQRFGMAVWSGDTDSTFDALQQQVRIGQNMALSGIYWWTSDIGGYSGGNITDPVFQELIVRWFQFGAFSPLFRIHGHRLPEDPPSEVCGNSGGPNEVWQFGSRAYEAIKVVLFLREKLRPYIMENMKLATERGIPIQRPLWFDFSLDLDTFLIDDQFMFGPQFMVAPILEYAATNRTVYFPKGATYLYWFDSNLIYKGGQTLVIQTTIDTFPLFTVKSDSDSE